MRRTARSLFRRIEDMLPRRPSRPRQRLPLPAGQVALPSPEGVALLTGAEPIGDYLRLAPYFVTQERETWCGPASMAIVLNALGVPPSSPPVAGEPGVHTQKSVFTERTEAIRARQAVDRQGLGLPLLADFLVASGATAELRLAQDDSLERFRATALGVLADPGRFVLVNYLRTALGQEGRGHTSPLAAYHRRSDRFLVLDVSRSRYPPFWVGAAALFAAMDTVAGKRSRGSVVVGRRRPALRAAGGAGYQAAG